MEISWSFEIESILDDIKILKVEKENAVLTRKIQIMR
jgi:hypothetical protein